MTTGRNLVVCLDGTKNEPEAGATNVARIYQIAVKDSRQLAYYDPGVGTMGARSALTRVGRAATRAAGLVVGYGIKENIEEAYNFLMHAYQPDDQIFVFGFSRGAYTARALVGMLRTVGLLRPGADNLIPYALKLYATGGKENHSAEEEKAFWKVRGEFNDNFGNPEFPSRFSEQVRFLGVWDTVKSVGWLNWRAQFEQAHWPFTRKVPNVGVGRHVIAIDERRRPYPEYRFDPIEVQKPGDRLREMWFTGVHSDVGGQFPDDHKLSDIALKWMVDEAVLAGLQIDPGNYRKMLNVEPEMDLPEDYALGRIHTNPGVWRLCGGWHRRRILDNDQLHDSVRYRIAATATDPKPYRRKLLRGNDGPG